GTHEDRIVPAVRSLLHDPAAYARMANAVNPYGDGRACARTVTAIARFFGLGLAPDEFDPDGRAAPVAVTHGVPTVIRV
ncbi:MAG TPA: hypothetical protein VK891_01085, partial [Euzebyales bacterium]|nr:hypothetical protein [Euzebyales bacterium]